MVGPIPALSRSHIIRHPMFLAAVLLASSAVAWADAPSHTLPGRPCISSGTTLDELIVLAARDNKDLQAARSSVDVARARLLQAGLRPNPRLDLGARSDFLFNNEGEYAISAGISQDFPIAGRIGRQKQVARVDIALAEAEIANVQRRIAEDIAGKFYKLLISQQQIVTLDGLIAVEGKLARITRNRFKAAEVSELDVNTVQLDAQRLMIERSLLLSEQQASTVAINTLVGRAPGTSLELAGALPGSDAIPGLQRLQDRALRQRPDFQGALLGVDRAASEAALARSQRWQDLTVGLELSQERQVVLGAPAQGTDRAIGVSVSVPLPLHNKSQGLIAEANANGDQARARVAALRAGIAAEVISAHAEATRLQSMLAQFRNSMLPTSQRSVRIARQGYDMGLIPVFEVVQAQRQLADLNKTYLATLDQFLQTLVRLHASAGDYSTDGMTVDLRPGVHEQCVRP